MTNEIRSNLQSKLSGSTEFPRRRMQGARSIRRAASKLKAMLSKFKMFFATLSVQSLLLTFALVIIAEFFFFLSAITNTEREQLERAFSRFGIIVAAIPLNNLEALVAAADSESMSIAEEIIKDVREFTESVEFNLKYRTSEDNSISIMFGSQSSDIHCRDSTIPRYDAASLNSGDYLREALYSILTSDDKRLIWVEVDLIEGGYNGNYINDNISEISICLYAVQDQGSLIRTGAQALSRALIVSFIVSFVVSLVVYHQITLPIKNLIKNLHAINRDPGRMEKLEDPSSRNYEIRSAEQAVHGLGNRLRWISSFQLKVESISHDFANRLHTEELLARELFSSNTLDRDLIGKIQKARESTMEVLNGILAGARFSTEGPKYEEIDVVTLVTRIKDDVAIREDEGITEFRIDVEGENPKIFGEQRFIYSALFNLAHNAVKVANRYQKAERESPERKTAAKKIKIRIRYWQDDEHSIFEISDTGPGIAPELRKNLFRLPIEYKDGAVHRVGMSDAEFNIRMHKGSIEYRTRHRSDGPGQTGTIFTIKLPTDRKKS